jgi:N-acetyl-gamma-glutamyl-phosphate reductase
MQHAQELIDSDTKVIDLAADFRLQNLAEFEKWYGMQHSCPTVLTESVYGLTELNREKIKNARVIGNPGCYPTTVQLGLAPLLKMIQPLSILKISLLMQIRCIGCWTKSKSWHDL